MACFYTSVAALQQRDKIFFNISQQHHWKRLHSAIPEQALQIHALKAGPSSLTASQTHTNMHALMACPVHCWPLNLHLKSASLLLTMVVLIPISGAFPSHQSPPAHACALWHPQHQMDEPLKELMKDPGPREEGQYTALHRENCSFCRM